MKKNFLAVLIFLFSPYLMAQSTQPNKNQRYFDINKNIDIFNSVLKELDMFYVDSIKVDSLVQGTVRKMLAGLDPYTEYYSEEEMDDFRFMTTGEYAGIGAVISYKDGHVIINEPYEGLPAAKAGLKAGDIILEVDDKDMRKATVQEVSNALRGMPRTTVKVKIQRPGENKPITLKIVREKITIHPVTHADIVNGNIGYFHFASFTENSAKEARKTFLDLKNKGAESLIIDLRGNGGGILEEAVSIVNMFVPKGEEIVSTKGKVKQWDRVYRTNEQPLDTLIPITVLIDTGSASASEIVAGSLQDLDRAVIIGNRSFGKGLVQTTRSLPYGGSIKLTTSKYYIPSGRCIQTVDYSHRNPDGSVTRVPDSLTQVFYTKNGREVREGGGITPDIIIEEDQLGRISYYLIMENIIFDYVTDWVLQHPTIAPPERFEFPDTDYESFKQFVKSKDFKYDQMSAKTMQTLQEIMKFEGYMDIAAEEFKALEAKLVPDLDRDLELFKEEIKDLIANEIVKRYYYKKGVLIYTLQKDKVYQKAIEVLTDIDTYHSILQPTENSLAETF